MIFSFLPEADDHDCYFSLTLLRSKWGDVEYPPTTGTEHRTRLEAHTMTTIFIAESTKGALHVMYDGSTTDRKPRPQLRRNLTGAGLIRIRAKLNWSQKHLRFRVFQWFE